MERKLAAILCADVYGYSRLMGEDEEATLRTLTSHRKLIDSAIEQHHGRFVNSAGDSVLAEFASAVEAVDCALISRAYSNLNGSVPTERAKLELICSACKASLSPGARFCKKCGTASGIAKPVALAASPS